MNSSSNGRTSGCRVCSAPGGLSRPRERTKKQRQGCKSAPTLLTLIARPDKADLASRGSAKVILLSQTLEAFPTESSGHANSCSEEAPSLQSSVSVFGSIVNLHKAFGVLPEP